ncbi:MAG: geranylgeranylglycerol-phosphate geranylgeranyltransferase [Candidatus Bathyarchaeia archaeon]
MALLTNTAAYMVIKLGSRMGKILGLIRLMRPINCAMMGFAVIVGAALTKSYMLNDYAHGLAFGFSAAFLLTAASMAINDYYDREIDAINEPKRPIPSGAVKPLEALIFALILAIYGLISAFLTNPSNFLCLFTATYFLLISIIYVTYGKKTGFFGNLLVSACVTAPFLYGSLIVENAVPIKTWIFASMVFLANTGREITKGIADVEGDKIRNVKTLAVMLGERKTAVIAVTFYLLAVALTPLPWFLGLVSSWFIPLVAITNLGLVISSIILLENPSRENAKKVKNQVLAWFFTGLLAFLLGSLG